MELKYVKNLASESPILLLHGQIGYDPEKGTGIDGARFAQELHYLDKQNVKKCTISINSPGGALLDAYSIFSAMQDVKMKVNTSNDGVAASAAGLILMGGNKVLMKDYAMLMMHNVSGGDSSPKSVEVTNLMNGSVRQIIKNRSGYDDEKITGWMNAETWMDASQCLEHKMVDEVISTGKKPNLQKAMNAATNSYNPAQLFQITNSLLSEEKEERHVHINLSSLFENANVEAGNLKSFKEAVSKALLDAVNDMAIVANDPTKKQIQPKNRAMKKVTDVLGLKEDASEDAIVSAVNVLVTKANEAEQSSTEAKAALTAANNSLTELRNAAATSLVESGIASGRIKGKDAAELETAKTQWLNLAKRDLEAATSALALVPVVTKTVTNPVNMKNLIDDKGLPGENADADQVVMSDEEKKYSHRDWEKKNSTKLAEIKAKMPVFYQNLYNQTYGK